MELGSDVVVVTGDLHRSPTLPVGYIWSSMRSIQRTYLTLSVPLLKSDKIPSWPSGTKTTTIAYLELKVCAQHSDHSLLFFPEVRHVRYNHYRYKLSKHYFYILIVINNNIYDRIIIYNILRL